MAGNTVAALESEFRQFAKQTQSRLRHVLSLLQRFEQLRQQPVPQSQTMDQLQEHEGKSEHFPALNASQAAARQPGQELPPPQTRALGQDDVKSPVLDELLADEPEATLERLEAIKQRLAAQIKNA